MLRNLINHARRLRVAHNQYPSEVRFLQAPNYMRIRPVAARYFSQETIADWPEFIKKFLEREHITQPTKIQEKTLSSAMANKDVVGIARTGSGKTLGFVIPAVMKILKEREHTKENDRYAGPSCLVLAPTRELATQTADVFNKFNDQGIRSIVLVGGSSRSEQVRRLQQFRHDVFVATPGRLTDLIMSGVVNVNQVKYLVLDEADRMLDMGFEPQVRQILKHLPKEGRQTLMWSATWPTEIQSLANEFMNDYDYVAIDSEKLKANPNIKQVVEVCSSGDKMDRLLDALKQLDSHKTLVFVNTKRNAERVNLELMRSRILAATMHGDRSQNQRDHVLRMFKSRNNCVLVATDVAARGLDINDITHVINFDFPNTIEDYIHRIGRTARHDKEGTSISYVTTSEAKLAGKLIRVLQETNQEVPDMLRKLDDSKHLYAGGDDFATRRRNRPRNDFYSGGDGRYRDRYPRNDRFERNDRFDRNNRSPRRSFLRDDDDDDDSFDNEDQYDYNERRPRSGQRGDGFEPRQRHLNRESYNDLMNY